MEIISYLLGKKSSGGGGSTGLDWKTLGYEPAPDIIVNDYNYSKAIQDNWDTSQTDLSNKFMDNTDLKYMPYVDLKNVTSTYKMFYNCTNLLSIPVLETSSSLEDMNEMFRNCQKLTEIDMSHFDTSNITSLSSTFRSCISLKKLDMRNFIFTNLESYGYVFSGVPSDCLIIVKNQTQKEWITTKFSSYTNVKTVDEL